MTTKALVFANGDLNDGPCVRKALADAPDAIVIAADGGTRFARHLNLPVHLIVGDMDSVDPALLDRLAAGGSEIERHSIHKDETDLELALVRAVERGATWVRIIGGIGDRLDQTLSNIYLLALPALHPADIALVHGNSETRLLLPGETTIMGTPGDTVSLIPLSGVARGVATQGLYYPLDNEDLLFGPARGVSNVMTGTTARVVFQEGVLLLVHTLGRA